MSLENVLISVLLSVAGITRQSSGRRSGAADFALEGAHWHGLKLAMNSASVSSACFIFRPVLCMFLAKSDTSFRRRFVVIYHAW